MKNYMIVTYGCQMNVHESEKLAGALKRLGFENECTDFNDADIIVFNTCCIRENAEDHAYGNIGIVKNIKKKKKDLIVAVGGCMTQQKDAAEKLHKTFPFVDVIFGSLNLDEFEQLVKEKIKQKKSVIKIIDENYGIVEGNEPFRTSYPNAWVNIMYGCNNFCTYCIVPYVRGRERSRDLNNIYAEVKGLVEQGYKEITLLGQNVNSYGNDLNGDESFAGLLNKISEIKGDYRLRFMSNHPKDLTEDMVKAMAANKNVCHLVHLPIQSGSTKVLKEMHRKYTKEDIFEKVNLIRKYMPDCAITTDVMVGFPGETEEDFKETLDVVEKVRFSGAFTFVYSRRKGTVADKMDNQIDEQTKKGRIMRLVDAQNAINREEAQKYVGKKVLILCEDYDKKKEYYLGRDEYGKMIYFHSNTDMIGKFVTITINKAGGISLYGTLTEE